MQLFVIIASICSYIKKRLRLQEFFEMYIYFCLLIIPASILQVHLKLGNVKQALFFIILYSIIKRMFPLPLLGVLYMYILYSTLLENLTDDAIA